MLGNTTMLKMTVQGTGRTTGVLLGPHSLRSAVVSRCVMCLLLTAHCDTLQKCAFLSCGQLDLESAATTQNDEFKAIFKARIRSCYSSKLSHETQYLAPILSHSYIR